MGLRAAEGVGDLSEHNPRKEPPLGAVERTAEMGPVADWRLMMTEVLKAAIRQSAMERTHVDLGKASLIS